MDVSELKVGEIYSLNGRRARLDKIGTTPGGDIYTHPHDPDEPYAEVTVSVGRSFDSTRVLRGSRWRKTVIGELQETWEGMKVRKQEEKDHRQEAERVSKELREVLSQMGMGGGFTDGRSATIYGDLSQMRQLTAVLAAHLEDSGSDSEALAELLG